MSYQSRLDAAIAAITDHNNSVGDESDKVDCDKFVTALKKMGGTSEASLASSSWEDLENCGLPRILARTVSGLFRSEGASETPEKIVDDDPVKHAARLKPEGLVAEYDLDNPFNPYGKRLQEIVAKLRGYRFIILDDEGNVNVPASQKELKRLIDGYPQRAQVSVDGGVRKTYAVGDRPNRYVQEHPVSAAVPLDSDGRSDKGVPWGKLDLEIRQLIHIAVETKELVPGRYEEFDLFDMIEGKEFEHLATRYPKAAVRFKDLEGLGDLPKLVVQLSNTNGGSGDKPQNPFGVNRVS